MPPRFFANPQDFRACLEAHHDTASDLVVGFHKRSSGVATRLRRLETLVDDSANGRRIEQLTRRPSGADL